MVFGPISVMLLRKEMLARYAILRILLIEEKLERLGRRDLLERLNRIPRTTFQKTEKVVQILDSYANSINDIEKIIEELEKL